MTNQLDQLRSVMKKQIKEGEGPEIHCDSCGFVRSVKLIAVDGEPRIRIAQR